MLSSTKPKELRAGIVGAGFMGSTHARAIRAAGGRVVAVVSSSEGTAARALEKTRAEVALTDFDALLTRDDIDVVHVCTPNNTHESFSIRAAEAGKSIICEKPLSVTGSSSSRVVAAANDAGVLGSVPFVYRFHPMVRELRARIAQGELGLPSIVHGSYLQDWLAASDATNWRVDSATGGRSRAFADIGSHWFDLYEFVTGDRVARVSAQTSTIFPQRAGSSQIATEDAVSVHFTTRLGVLGTLVVSQVAAGRKNRLHLEISGTEASFAFDQEAPEGLWMGNSAGATDLIRDPSRLSSDAARLSFLPAGHPQGYQDAFNSFVADSYALFDGTGVPEVNAAVPQLAAGQRAAELCDAVMDSAINGGGWINTTESFTLDKIVRTV
jgi:predicted dehydrogenase